LNGALEEGEIAGLESDEEILFTGDGEEVLDSVVRLLGVVTEGDLGGEFPVLTPELLLLRMEEMGRDLLVLEKVLGMAWTFFMSWNGIMAGMECIAAGNFGALLGELVLVSPLTDLLTGNDLEEISAGLGESELTFTWSLLVPKLLTDGELCLVAGGGWGIFRPNLFVSCSEETGLVKARVVMGDWVMLAAAARTRLLLMLLM